MVAMTYANTVFALKCLLGVQLVILAVMVYIVVSILVSKNESKK